MNRYRILGSDPERIPDDCVDIAFRTADGIEGTFMVSEHLLRSEIARGHVAVLITDAIRHMRRPVLLGREEVTVDVPGFPIITTRTTRDD